MGAAEFCINIYRTFWAHAVRPYHWRDNKYYCRGELHSPSLINPPQTLYIL